jgi:c-di-AMP phosphodiesterase-like protein
MIDMTENDNNMKQQLNSDYAYIGNLPVPACVVDVDGNVICANSLMKNVFAYDDIIGSNFFALTGIKRKELEEAGTAGEDGEAPKEMKIRRNEQYFVLQINTDTDPDKPIIVYFENVTEREDLRKSYRDEHVCIMYITIDNYDELISSITEDSKLAVPTEVDRVLRKWAEENDGSLDSTSEDTYVMSLYRKDAESIIEGKFAILDEIRSINTKIDFPVSLSIGLGMGGESLRDTMELAEAAMELAMGRGGDQAVVKNGDRTHYYGGKLQSMEKNNKGKSRVIAHALKQLVLESSNVLVMGHQWPDMDCFGSAIGAYKIAKYLGKDAAIVIEDYNEALQVIYEQAKETEDYVIVRKDKADELVGEKTLLIVVDTHRPYMVEYPELLDKVNSIVVIDHHRLSEDSIENLTLSYVESYASSASELMTEIIQYTANKRIINKFEAEAMLAGITVDTNSFSIKTGVRTFEAAAWLRRAGADTTEVKRFFQTEVTSFQAKAEAIANAEYLDAGIAISISEGYSTEAQIINAQVADELLMVKGVKASFAVGRNDQHLTVISARSLGDVNVQVIMERFNGGGHLTSAGAQVNISPEEVVEQLKKILPDYLDTGEDEEMK